MYVPLFAEEIAIKIAARAGDVRRHGDNEKTVASPRAYLPTYRPFAAAAAFRFSSKKKKKNRLMCPLPVPLPRISEMCTVIVPFR